MKKPNLWLLTLLVSSAWGWSAPVLADQCAYISKSQALAALNYLSIGKTVHSFCELCGDRSPQPLLVKQIAATTTSDGQFWQIFINNKGIDLAYTYVDYEPRYRVNLAMITKCPARDFTPILNIKNN